jgi:hypothetical protein
VLATLAATDYRLLGSGVESDCKKRSAFPFELMLFNYFFVIFLRIIGLCIGTHPVVDGGVISDKDIVRCLL